MAKAANKRGTVSRAALACALALATGGPAATRADEAHLVKDPHFGEVLYYFFQENYFSALSQLMVAQHFGRVPHHSGEAELLRGGMLLSYGANTIPRQHGHVFHPQAN